MKPSHSNKTVNQPHSHGSSTSNNKKGMHNLIVRSSTSPKVLSSQPLRHKHRETNTNSNKLYKLRLSGRSNIHDDTHQSILFEIVEACGVASGWEEVSNATVHKSLEDKLLKNQTITNTPMSNSPQTPIKNVPNNGRIEDTLISHQNISPKHDHQLNTNHNTHLYGEIPTSIRNHETQHNPLHPMTVSPKSLNVTTPLLNITNYCQNYFKNLTIPTEILPPDPPGTKHNKPKHHKGSSHYPPTHIPTRSKAPISCLELTNHLSQLISCNKHKSHLVNLLYNFSHSITCIVTDCKPLCRMFKRIRLHFQSVPTHNCHLSLTYSHLLIILFKLLQT